jgi:hypothetical protein
LYLPPDTAPFPELLEVDGAGMAALSGADEAKWLANQHLLTTALYGRMAGYYWSTPQ